MPEDTWLNRVSVSQYCRDEKLKYSVFIVAYREIGRDEPIERIKASYNRRMYLSVPLPQPDTPIPTQRAVNTRKNLNKVKVDKGVNDKA